MGRAKEITLSRTLREWINLHSLKVAPKQKNSGKVMKLGMFGRGGENV